MVDLVEEIAIKQETNPKGNLFPLEKLGKYEVVYAGDQWQYKYNEYHRHRGKRSLETKKCPEQPSSSSLPTEGLDEKKPNPSDQADGSSKKEEKKKEDKNEAKKKKKKRKRQT